MKIAIISDTHDNLVNLDKCLKYLKKQKIKLLIHCGDISTFETLKELSQKFNGQIYACLGNMDIDPDEIETKAKLLKNVEFFNQSGLIQLDGLNILFTHKPETATKLLAKKNQVNLVFVGHTHKPWVEKQNKITVLNPGTLAGMFTPPTFAVFDTQVLKPELILVNNL